MNSKPMDKLHTEFGFTTPIPDEIIKAMPAIKPAGFTVWCYLMFRIYNAKRTAGTFDCFPGVNLISKETGIGRGTVIKAIKCLEKEGFLIKKRRFSNSTIYTLTGTEVQKSKNWTNEVESIIFESPEVQKLDYQKSKICTTEVQKLDSNQDKDNQDEDLTKKKININTLLSKIGIKKAAIKTLINEKPIERLRHGLDVYEQGIARKEPLKPGWYMDFINEDWDDPSWYALDSDSDESRQRYING